MARSIRELEELSLYDGRFYMGTIRDWGPLGNNGVFVSTPEFKRRAGQVVGIECANMQAVDVSNPVVIGQEFTVEVISDIRSAGGGGGGTLFRHATASLRIYIAGTNTLRFACTGTYSWATPITLGNRYHLIMARDLGGNVYSRINGILVNTAALGNGTGSGTATFGNCADLGPYGRYHDGPIFMGKILNTCVTSEEAALLYEHSRIQLQPGAPKRSGIMSVR